MPVVVATGAKAVRCRCSCRFIVKLREQIHAYTGTEGGTCVNVGVRVCVEGVCLCGGGDVGVGECVCVEW